MIWRVLPMIGFVLFLALGLSLRPYLHRRRYGSWGVVLFRTGRRDQTVRDAILVLMLVLLAVLALNAMVAPAAASPFLPAPVQDALRPLGAVVLFGGLALFVIAQHDLGASWRIGIEEAARPGLVTTGFYRFCRNPIFLFMVTMLAGFALMVPNWLSVGLFIGGCLGVSLQARAEEAYLLRAYGDDYRAYARRVGRFLPRVGRLS